MINNLSTYQLATIIKRFVNYDRCEGCPIINWQSHACNNKQECKLTICKYLSSLTLQDIPNVVTTDNIFVSDEDYQLLYDINSIQQQLEQIAEDVINANDTKEEIINNDTINTIKLNIKHTIEENYDLMYKIKNMIITYNYINLQSNNYQTVSVNSLYETEIIISDNTIINITFPILIQMIQGLEKYVYQHDSELIQVITEQLTPYTKR